MKHRKLEKTNKEKYSNKFAQDYYNSLAHSLTGEYGFYRWFSSPAAKLDFTQTKKSLLAVLGKKRFNRILEIGCGDGVWTKILAERTNSLDVVDQSQEMLKRAKKRLKLIKKINYVHSDILRLKPLPVYDLVVSVRAFEYFDDKEKAGRILWSFLNDKGSLVLITKNSLRRIRAMADGSKHLHSMEITRKKVTQILKNARFRKIRIYPAILKGEANKKSSRLLNHIAHRFILATSGLFNTIDLLPWMTESYIFTAKKN